MPTLNEPSLSRRSALRVIGVSGAAALLAACSQTAAPASPPSAPAEPAVAPAAPTMAPAAGATTSAPVASTGQELAALTAAARAEKSLTIATYAGSGYRTFVEAFQAVYPDIQVEHNQFQPSSRDFVPRLLQELKAGIHTWDAAIMPLQEMLRQVRTAGGLDPIRPAIVAPDVLLDSSWVNGYEAGFYDLEKRWGFALSLSRQAQFWVNGDQVKDGEITGIKDLLDPKWRGKILAADPRTKGSGFLPATVLRLNAGEGIIKDLYLTQEATLSTDNRQLTEFMVRGRYAIGVGAIDEVILRDFMDQGLGSQLKPVEIPEGSYINSSNHCAWLMSQPPHPNAGKLFINWAMSKDAGSVISRAVEANSRRADVTPFDASKAFVPGAKLINVDAEELIEEIEKTQKLAKDVLN